MIAKLRGQLDASGEDWAIVDVSGVGYLVYCSSRCLNRLAAMPGPVSLLVETHVREDHIHLYGFVDAAERDWFRLLSTVQGVGAKMALAVLSSLAPEELIQAIAAQDKGSLTRANGVGPKLAGRIVAELKDKAGGMMINSVGTIETGAGRQTADSGPTQEAISALVNLGYRPAEAYGAVARVSQTLGAEASLEALIRGGLKELVA